MEPQRELEREYGTSGVRHADDDAAVLSLYRAGCHQSQII